MLHCSRSSGIQHHAWFDNGYVFLRQSHDKFGHPSFEMSRSFLNQVLAHFDLLRNWQVTKVYLWTRIGPCFARGQSDCGHHQSCAVVQASCEAITWYVVGRHGGAFQHQVHGVEESLCGLSIRRSGASYAATCSVAEGNFAQQAQLCGGDLGSLESFSRSWATGFGGRCSSYESCFASALTRHSDAVRETRPMRRCTTKEVAIKWSA